MISQWWSFILTAIGVTGLVCVYRYPSTRLGPGIGLAAQALWITYAVVTRQWWFLASAFAYGGANVYGIRTRRAATSTTEQREFTSRFQAAQEDSVLEQRTPADLDPWSGCGAVGLHSHTADQPCDDSCSTYDRTAPSATPTRKPPPGGAGEAKAR